MRLQYVTLLSVFFIFASPLPSQAANPGVVVINEIAWMGTTNYHGDEWIELYNNTDAEIALTGWTLKSTDDTPAIILEGSIAAREFFLLERTDETSVPDKQADQIYVGALGNDGEYLQLTAVDGNSIDEVNSFGSWFGGDNTTKQTMERKNPTMPGSDATSWGTSANPGGTPKAQNSVYTPLQNQEPAPSSPDQSSQPNESLSSESNNTTTTTTGGELLPNQSTSTPPQSSEAEVSPSAQSATTTPTESAPKEPAGSQSTATTTSQITYPSNLFINELMPFPLGPDEQEEWIEVVNENDEQADISGWAVQDSAGVVNTYLFLEGSLIAGHGHLVLSRPTTKITLNNDADGVHLLTPTKEVVHAVQFENAPKGKSYARNGSGWSWSDVPTPGSANIIPQAPAQPTQPSKVSQAPPQQQSRQVTNEEMQKILQMYKDAGQTPPEYLESPQEPTTPELDVKTLGLESEPESEDDLRAKQIASITEGGQKNQKNFIVFMAIILALFSAVFIFLLQKRAQKTP